MDNIILYYENNYSKCYFVFRCKMDLNYELLWIVLISKYVKKLFDKIIKECVIYKYF